MASLRLDRLRKRFPGGAEAVQALSLSVDAGQRCVILGPSGSGKTTLLRLMAGLETPTEGSVWIDNEDQSRVAAQRRGVGLVCQEPIVYAHLTVGENLAFPLRLRRVAEPEIARRVAEVAAELGLMRLVDRSPDRLSGGERQRVALGRALIRRPRVLLLDEPFAHLDPHQRMELRGEVVRALRQHHITTVMVTHDQQEALALGEKIAVLRDGMLQQCGSPERLLDAPRNRFVAQFVGTPPRLLVRGQLVAGSESSVCFSSPAWDSSASSGPLASGLPIPPCTADRLRSHLGRFVWLGIRPDRLRSDGNLGARPAAESLRFAAQVVEASPGWGNRWTLLVRTDAGELAGLIAGAHRPDERIDIEFSWRDAEFYADDADGQNLFLDGGD